MKTVTVMLGETEYKLHPLTVGEIEQIADIMGGDLSRARVPFAILRIAMARAEPPCEDVNALVATPKQIGDAVAAVMSASGLEASGEEKPATGAA